MFYIRIDTFLVFLLVFLKLKFLNAQTADKTNHSSGINLVESRFFDGGQGMGYPNPREQGRYGNPSSNYPGNSFFPNSNQYGNSQPGFGGGPSNQDINQGRPHQGLNSYPNNYLGNRPGNYPSNYPGNYPSNYPGNYPNNYPGNYPSNYPSNNPNNYPSNYPNNYPSSYTNNYPNNYPRNYPDDYTGEQEDSPYNQRPNNFNPNYNGDYKPNQNINNQKPYYNAPGYSTEYPGNVNKPYENGGIPTNQDNHPNWPSDQFGYPTQNNQYPSQGKQGNPNLKLEGVNPDFRPDDILDSNIKYPSSSNVRPNQYPPNNIPGNSYPNDQTGIQFPYQSYINQDQGNRNPNQVFQGNFNGVPPSRPPIPNGRPIDSINGPNANDSANAPGKPVFVPSSNSPTGQGMLGGSTESPSQNQCQQSCPTTPEYDPICGTNNVTYANSGRFNCARNCGVAVEIRLMGKCPSDNLTR